MPKVPVYNTDKKKVGDVTLADNIFAVDVKEHLLYSVVRYQRAKARAGTHAVKGRTDVRGGGRKPWKQKGTGRARQGTIRAPQWRGGGVVFGPTVRSHAFKLNKKVRKAALCSALTRRAEQSCVVVLDAWAPEAIKTRQVADMMKAFELKNMLLVTGDNENLQRSARNLPTVTVLNADGVNVYDVLHRDNVVFTQAALDAVVSRLSAE